MSCGCDPDVPSEVQPSLPFNDPEVNYPLPEVEPFLLPLCLTRPQYQAIVDSLTYARGLLSDNGCYNEYTAIDLLLSHLPFANKPLEIPCMDACDIISECIDTNPGTQTAISNFLTQVLLNDPTFMQELSERLTTHDRRGTELTEGEWQGTLTPQVIADECQLDELYGATGGVVRYFNRAIEDVFQALEQASNTIEYSAAAVELAPAVGSSVSAALELADQVQETLAEAYTGEYTVELEDDLICDVFCEAKLNDCTLTLETINQVLLDRLTTIDFDDFAEFVLYFTTGAFEGEQVVEVAFMLVVQALRYGNQFAGVLGLSPVAAIAKRAAEEDPSNAWEELCEDCDSPECILFNADNADGWSFVDSGEADPPEWRKADAGTNMQGSNSTLALFDYRVVTFEWDLSTFDVVGYSYIRVITDEATYSYAGGFTGSVEASQAILNIDPGETIHTIEYLITGGSAASQYELNYISVCPG